MVRHHTGAECSLASGSLFQGWHDVDETGRRDLLVAFLWLPGRVQLPLSRPSKSARGQRLSRPGAHSCRAGHPHLYFHFDLFILHPLRQPASPRLSNQAFAVRHVALSRLWLAVCHIQLPQPAASRRARGLDRAVARIFDLCRLARLFPDHCDAVLCLLLALLALPAGGLVTSRTLADRQQPDRHRLLGTDALLPARAAGLPALDCAARLAVSVFPGHADGAALPFAPARQASAAILAEMVVSPRGPTGLAHHDRRVYLVRQA